ncbi:hypothetical protein JK358_29250 [Nocardia sp. 2]|uniref:Lipoprotein n=1 Tax=Nocardia acididurans TaxID=2802282 RepID=A0ABS1ME04_9NOCA|nr:hypothetical protein [Nocardia acididurans]MBL1078499.1 hypothetical protein [Nocardia acididurans]
MIGIVQEAAVFAKKCALFAVAGAAALTLCSPPASADPDSEFITLDAVLTSTSEGLRASGIYFCDGGIGYLDVSASIGTSGSGTIQLTSSPPGVTLQCTGQREPWTVLLKPTNGMPVLVPYTEGTGKAQLNRKYWKVDSGEVPLHV